MPQRKPKLTLGSGGPTHQEVVALHAEAAAPDAALSRLENLDINSAGLEQLASIARDAHTSVRIFDSEALRAALVAGRALMAARERFSYDRNAGGFRGWVEGNTGVPLRTAYRYLSLVQNSEIVCQSGTLSDAYAAIAASRQQSVLEGSSDSPPLFVQMRLQAALTPEADGVLRAIAQQRGCTPSTLVTELIETWAKRQARKLTIDVTAAED
jgi:hypothetical protein